MPVSLLAEGAFQRELKDEPPRDRDTDRVFFTILFFSGRLLKGIHPVAAKDKRIKD